MVNLNFKKFKKVQQEHKGIYLGGENQQHGLNDHDYNDQDNTDKSIGATGRTINGKIK